MNNLTSAPDAAAARRKLVGESIVEHRVRWGVDPQDVAEQVGIDLAELERWEKGEVDLTFEQALAIEEAVKESRGTLGAAGRYFSYETLPASNESFVSTHWYSTSEEMLDAVKAADVLGLGVRVRNEIRCLEVNGDESVHEERWVVDLYQGAPWLDETLG